MINKTAKGAMAMRPLKLRRNYTMHAEGSVLVEAGKTKVLCTASVEDGVPPFRREKGGWLTAEYGMLPRSTSTRMAREAARGKQGGRTVEISRLIGRSLRAAVDLEALGSYTITVDCDVLQADGGTRCASITGGMVALVDALRWMKKTGRIEGELPLRTLVAAISVGIVDGVPVPDLCYEQDCRADVDMNVVMTEEGNFVELQGTAEGNAFSDADLDKLRGLARLSLAVIFTEQRKVLRLK